MNAQHPLIFNSLQPHGIRPNRSTDKVRIAPIHFHDAGRRRQRGLRQWRISSWKETKAPEGYAFPGDPRGWEQTKYKAAELSDLEQKLLGLDRWVTLPLHIQDLYFSAFRSFNTNLQ